MSNKLAYMIKSAAICGRFNSQWTMSDE